MVFNDRKHAGNLLAEKLTSYRGTQALIVGLARGGVVVAHAIARALLLPLEVLKVKKISSPDNPEFAISAVVPDGQFLRVGGKTIILVDDGAATGTTMEAAITWCKARNAHKIIVALPVAHPDVAKKINSEVDACIVLETPSSFHAVGEFYRDFSQVTDGEVVQLFHI